MTKICPRDKLNQGRLKLLFGRKVHQKDCICVKRKVYFLTHRITFSKLRICEQKKKITECINPAVFHYEFRVLILTKYFEVDIFLTYRRQYI